jgi:FG-GAP-like repeat/Domain of unknown function (DUF4214)
MKLRLKLEHLESREVPANPTQLGSPVTLAGANSTWDYSDGGSFTPSPVFADVDGTAGDEFLTVTGDKKIAAYKIGFGLSINLLRTYDTGAGAAEIHSSPMVVNIPGTGNVVFAGAMDGKVYAWNASSGALLPGWPATVDVPDTLYPQGNQRNSILGHLAAGDLDNDLVPEIVVTSYNQHVTALKMSGSVLWRYANDDSVLSGVAIGDIDRDGSNDVIIGGDYSSNAFYDAGGNVTALSSQGRRKWIKQLPQIAQSSPVLADINNDGKLEIFIGTGINFTNINGAAYPGNAVYGLDSAGNDLPGWPYITGPGTTDFRTPSPPALGDLNNDGVPEIIIGDYSGKLHAVRSNGTALWSVQAIGAPLFAAPVVADIDGDNDMDVVQLSNSQIRGFDGTTGTMVWDFVDDGNLRQYINSAAIGKFIGDGSFQLGVMANGTAVAGQPRSPSYIRFFNIAASTKTPEWTAARGDAAHNVIRKTASFADAYITKLATYLGRTGGGITSLVNDWRQTFRTSPGMYDPSAGIIISNEGRSAEIRSWYTKYLDRSAEQAGVDGWLTYLSTGNTFSKGQAAVLGSVEAFYLSGPTGQSSATNQTWVTYLYRRLLGRTPSGGEDTGWVNALNAGQLTRETLAFQFLMSQEQTQTRIQQWYTAYQFGGSTTPPAATLHAAAWDLRRGLTEETVLLRLMTSGMTGTSSDYLDLMTEGSVLKAIYRDALGREAASAELIGWMQQMEAGTTLATVSRNVIRSTEKHQQLVRGYFSKYLHRTATPSNAEITPYVNQLNSGVRREQIIATLMASNEYYVYAGSTASGFVNAVWMDILGRAPTGGEASAVAYWTGYTNTRNELPLALMGTDEYCFNTIKNDWMIKYVRRYPNTASNQSALFNVPSDPYLPVRDYINYMKAGGQQSEVEIQIVISPEYINLARGKAFWTGKRWKI